MTDEFVKEKLNRRSDKFTIVLNDSGADLLKNARFVFNKIMCAELDVIFCAVILHDKDMDEAINQLKTPHYHVILTFSGSYRASTILRWLSCLFHINENQVSIDKCNSLVMQTRYLCHIDDFDKFQYSVSDVITNNNDLLNKFYTYVRSIDSIDDLIVLCHQFPKLTDLMCKIGYENYRKYRVVISDIRKEMSVIY